MLKLSGNCLKIWRSKKNAVRLTEGDIASLTAKEFQMNNVNVATFFGIRIANLSWELCILCGCKR